MTRVNNDALDALIETPLIVLGDGFVRVVDYMGDDSAIVQAARVSYGAGTKQVQEDAALIRYLMRHNHTTPFEMCELKLHIRAPMDVWRQWIRHRTASVNEYSTRYSIAIDSALITSPDGWRRQSVSNKQGSGDFLPSTVGEQLTQAEADIQIQSRQVYEARLEAGVAREQARKDLPLSTYTEAYWKCDLHNLLHFLQLRMHSHAQAEIRSYATVIANHIVSIWVPATWQAFLDYRVDAMSFSRNELAILRALTKGERETAIDVASQLGFLQRKDGKLAPSRERVEVEQKLIELGYPIPWVTP